MYICILWEFIRYKIIMRIIYIYCVKVNYLQNLLNTTIYT